MSQPPQTSPIAGSGGLRKARVTATRPASPTSTAPTFVPPLTVTVQPLAASTITAPGTQSGPSYTPQGSGTPWGPWFPQPIMGGTPCPTQQQQPLAPRTPHRGRALPGGRGSPNLLWAESPAPHRNSSPWPLVHPTGVGHSLGAVVPPTYYGQNPLSHTATAALVSLAAATVLPTAASHSGPGSGSSGQDALRARVGSSASLFWGAPQALSTQGGRILDPRPLSRLVFTAAVPYAVISGVAWSQCDHPPESDNNSSQGLE